MAALPQAEPPHKDRATALRRALVGMLKAKYASQVPLAIEQALLTVPRHLFCPPGTTLEEAYANDVVPSRTDEATGHTRASVSAPWLHARMLFQAQIEPGMRVLELGSSDGYLACLIAELVGSAGQVVTLDADPHAADVTRAAVARTGYVDRVTVDSLGHGMFDRIIVTSAVWDIAPAWVDQLADDGVLVVPLRARHPSECWSTGFRRDGDLLVGEMGFVCGFAGTGAGAREPLVARMVGPDGVAITFRTWDDDTDLSGLPATLPEANVLVPSGVVLPPPGMFVGLRTRLAYDLPGLVDIDISVKDRDRMGYEADKWMRLGHVEEDSFAVVCFRPDGFGQTHLDAIGFGPRAEQVAFTVVGQIAAWGRDGMPHRAAHVYRPAGSATPLLEGRVLYLPNGELAVTQHHDGVDDL